MSFPLIQQATIKLIVSNKCDILYIRQSIFFFFLYLPPHPNALEHFLKIHFFIYENKLMENVNNVLRKQICWIK